MDERTRSSVLASIVRSSCLFRGFAAVGKLDERGQLTVEPEVGDAIDGLPIPVTLVPELDVLRERSPDAIVLFNPNGLAMAVRVIRWQSSGANGGWQPAMTLDDALALGGSLLGYVGSINGARMPISIELIDVFDGNLPSDAVRALAELRKIGHGIGGQTARVNVSLSLLDAEHGVARSNAHGLGRRRFEGQLRHAWEQRQQGVEHWQAMLSQAGVHPKSVALGVVVGGTLEVAGLFALLGLGARDGMLYGATMVIASIIGATVALRPAQQRARSAGHVEALIGGLGALAIGIVCWVVLGGSIGFGTATVVVAATMACAAIGSVANTI